MISGEIEVNQFAQTHLTVEDKHGDDPSDSHKVFL